MENYSPMNNVPHQILHTVTIWVPWLCCLVFITNFTIVSSKTQEDSSSGVVGIKLIFHNFWLFGGDMATKYMDVCWRELHQSTLNKGKNMKFYDLNYYQVLKYNNR